MPPCLRCLLHIIAIDSGICMACKLAYVCILQSDASLLYSAGLHLKLSPTMTSSCCCTKLCSNARCTAHLRLPCEAVRPAADTADQTIFASCRRGLLHKGDSRGAWPGCSHPDHTVPRSLSGAAVAAVVQAPACQAGAAAVWSGPFQKGHAAR